jgi:outer membrane protein assembly factor BamB
MLQHHNRIRVVALGFLPAAAVVLVLLAGGERPAQAYVDAQLPTLTDIVWSRSESGLGDKRAFEIAVLRVEKINREKKAIAYRKLRDLKGAFPGQHKQFEGTFTHVLRPMHNSPNFRAWDVANQERLNEQVLTCAAEGKKAVVFQRLGARLICVGQAWYSVDVNPLGRQHLPQAAASDARYSRVFCGDVEELITAVTDLLARKAVTVPRMVGNDRMLNDRTAPIRRGRADRYDEIDAGHFGRPGYYMSPFRDQAPWSTHRGNARRTGADDGPGPKGPKVLWVHKSENQFIAPLDPGAKDLYASSLGGFNTPGFHALDLDPAGVKQLRWSKQPPLLTQPIAGAPALVQGHTALLVFGDGFHSAEGATLRCLRAADGFPLWQLPVAGKLVHFEGTPTVAADKLYVGGGNAGVLCVAPSRVTFEGKEQDLRLVQPALEQRWKELLAKYEVEKKKDPEFTLPPDEDRLPLATPKRLWQQGKDKWHVDAPVAVVGDRVLAASAYLDDEKAGERALVCLKAGDGSVVWKAPLKLNPWAGPTVGPYVLVGCSSIRLDPKAIPGATGEVVAIELDTGKVKWRKEVPGGVLASVAVKAGLAIFTATDGKVRAWDAFTGREKWAYDAKSPFFAGPAVAKNTVYAADLRGVVHALNLADGKREWTLDLAADPATKTGAMVYGSPMVHGGRLHLATCNPGDTRAQAAGVFVCIGDKVEQDAGKP